LKTFKANGLQKKLDQKDKSREESKNFLSDKIAPTEFKTKVLEKPGCVCVCVCVCVFVCVCLCVCLSVFYFLGQPISKQVDD